MSQTRRHSFTESVVNVAIGYGVAKFRHKREEGLTKCLQRAAEAAEKAKREDVGRLLLLH